MKICVSFFSHCIQYLLCFRVAGQQSIEYLYEQMFRLNNNIIKMRNWWLTKFSLISAFRPTKIPWKNMIGMKVCNTYHISAHFSNSSRIGFSKRLHVILTLLNGSYRLLQWEQSYANAEHIWKPSCFHFLICLVLDEVER